jgi:hypothetical protein
MPASARRLQLETLPDVAVIDEDLQRVPMPKELQRALEARRSTAD